jgi:iron-sulfur cluster repair protein YtfE (RIC family)
MAHDCTCRCDSSTDPGSASASLRPDETVDEVVRRQAGALEILKEMGINHCCGAHLTLREAAAASGVSLDLLLAALAG